MTERVEPLTAQDIACLREGEFGALDTITIERLISIATDHARLHAENAKLRERVGKLAEACRLSLDPCVSFWTVSEPAMRAALAGLDEEPTP